MSVLFRQLARLFNTPSNPSGVASGDVWWRSDISQLHASDGSASPIIAGPTGNLPVVRSGAWHPVPTSGAPAAVGTPDGRLFAVPLWPGRSCTLNAVAINVTIALVGGSVRLGLYESNGSIPTSLIDDYGTVATGVTGVQQITALSTSLRPVLHFLAIARQGGLLNLGLSSRDTSDSLVSDTAPVLTVNRSAYFIDGVTGPLPASFGAISGTVQGPSATLLLT